MCEVIPYMVSVATKPGISLIYCSLPWYISYIPQRGTFDLNHKCGIYVYVYKELCVGGSKQKSVPYFPYKHRCSILGS